MRSHKERSHRDTDLNKCPAVLRGYAERRRIPPHCVRVTALAHTAEEEQHRVQWVTPDLVEHTYHTGIQVDDVQCHTQTHPQLKKWHH